MNTNAHKIHIFPSLICPKSHLPLNINDNYLYTQDRQYSYQIIDNIPIFCNLDSFYENRWAKTDMSVATIRNFLIKKQRFFIKHLRSQTGKVLDLGCGGGWNFFTTLGSVTGVDLSVSSLKTAQHIYDHVVQADWTMLPFPDNCFDFVVSSDVLGHVPYSDKDKVWNEIVRVLRPGGITAHYIEADSDDPLMNWCKQYPDLYQQYVIDTEGHIGMESARATILRFRKHRLEPLSEEGVYRLLMYVHRLPLLLNNEYRDKSSNINLLLKMSQLLLSNKFTESTTNLCIAGLLEISDRIFPESWSNGVLVAYQKSKFN